MPTDVSITGAALHAFLNQRLTGAAQVYGVVDAARDWELAFEARDRYGQQIRSLFADDAGSHMADVAPYLVPIALGQRYPSAISGYLDQWADHFGNSAGIFLLTDTSPRKLHIHLRNVFRATDEEYNRYYFRFYDPRVLRPFIPACSASEAAEFFGPIQEILVESESAQSMLCCRAGAGGAVVSDEAFTRPGAPSSTGRRRP